MFKETRSWLSGKANFSYYDTIHWVQKDTNYIAPGVLAKL